MLDKKSLLLLVELDKFLYDLRENLIYFEFGQELSYYKNRREGYLSEGYMWFTDNADDSIHKLRQKIKEVLNED